MICCTIILFTSSTVNDLFISLFDASEVIVASTHAYAPRSDNNLLLELFEVLCGLLTENILM